REHVFADCKHQPDAEIRSLDKPSRGLNESTSGAVARLKKELFELIQKKDQQSVAFAAGRARRLDHIGRGRVDRLASDGLTEGGGDLLKRIGEAPDDKHSMSACVQPGHQPGSKQRALSDS